MKLFRFLLICLISIVLALKSHDNFEIAQSDKDVSVILGEIITNYFIKYFSGEQMFISIILAPSKIDQRDFQEDLFVNLFDDPKLTEFASNTLDRLDDAVRDHQNAFNLILVDNSKSLSNVLNENTTQEFHLAQKFLIVVTEKTRFSCRENLDNIFGILWSNGLTNSHVLCQDEMNFWPFYTFMPYQQDCFNLNRLKLTTFTPLNFTNNMTLTIDELYPQKLKTFNNCPLYVAPSTIRPLVIPTNSTDGKTIYKGIDVEIITQIAKALNFAIEFKTSADRTGHGVILQNGTVTGNMHLVISGEVNVTIGGFALSEERFPFFSPSNPYLQASMGFCYKQTVESVPFTNITAPFRSRVWIVICILLLVSIIIILLTKKLSRKWRHFFIGGRMNRTSILNMWSSLLGIPICNPRIVSGRNFGTFARTLLLLWVILWFVIRSSYQGALYTYLQSHRLTSPYDTIEKIRASNCKVISTYSGYTFLKNMFSRDRMLLNGTVQSENLRTLYDEDINGVVLTSDISQKAFNLENSPHRRLAFTKDRLFMYSPVFLFRKKSILTGVINKQLQLLRETGLVDFWTKNYIDDRKTKSKHRQPSKLRMENVLAAFHICGIMYLISFCVFILEVISIKCHRIKLILDYFTY